MANYFLEMYFLMASKAQACSPQTNHSCSNNRESECVGATYSEFVPQILATRLYFNYLAQCESDIKSPSRKSHLHERKSFRPIIRDTHISKCLLHCRNHSYRKGKSTETALRKLIGIKEAIFLFSANCDAARRHWIDPILTDWILLMMQWRRNRILVGILSKQHILAAATEKYSLWLVWLLAIDRFFFGCVCHFSAYFMMKKKQIFFSKCQIVSFLLLIY